ncbi:FAD:protein FMN transferase [Candidatus Methylobacter favarea]|uniref:FAD:protein FMN transferase n=1 Tax=Candidatus Methylobacter favarea TaxID=2707345 RepID=A0A8S0Y705_9GAMM|nr:FAD:protein FMN transferase [Candidatus Methylobacter favarea]CAA9892599.1 FAD:protein FMN transferase [Candidatus Methylobacter favarea]
MINGCAQPEEVEKFGGYAQGTTYHVSFWSQQAADVKAVKQEVDAEFSRLDQQLSNYRKDSVIEQFNAKRNSEPQAVGEEIVTLLEQARTVSQASGGCYDLTIKPLFELWGFRDDKLTPPDEPALQAAQKQVGFAQVDVVDATHLRKHIPNLEIDLSSIAQGYSVKRISALLEKQGIENYLVEIGGELQTRGHKPDGAPWRVALEKPLSGERTMQKVITIRQTGPLAVMTSGTYRHFFDLNGKRYSHILNARTGKPVDHETVSVTVLHADPVQADAWSTALLCLGRKAGIEAADTAGIAALFIEQQGNAFNEYGSAAMAALRQVTLE